jgi:esterase/lipase superfamily enzyme
LQAIGNKIEANHHTMNFFITNREIITTKGGQESVREDGKENAADKLRFGIYEKGQFNLFPEPDSETEAIYADTDKADPASLKGSARFFRTLYEELVKGGEKTKNNNVLFFIHGFNTDLKGVRSTFDWLQRSYANKPGSPIRHIVIFTWPGMSPLIPFHYFNDRNDAIHSGEALARGIEKLTRFFRDFLRGGDHDPCNRKIHLMVHSMGNRVLKHMLLELERKQIRVPELFSEVLLMAADIEYNIFEPGNPFTQLIDLGKRVHIYYHEEDRVLDISKYTKNFSNRLGRYGRKKSDSNLSDVIDANVTKVKDDLDRSLKSDKGNHWYYYSSSQVVEDVLKVLNGKRSEFRV